MFCKSSFEEGCIERPFTLVGKYGLSIPIFKTYKQTVSNPMVRFGIDGHNPIDFSEIMFVMNNINNNCF